MNISGQQNQGRLSRQITWILFVILSLNTIIAVSIAGSHFMKEYVSLMQSRVETVASNLKTLMQDILELELPIGSLQGIEKELEKTVRGDLKALYSNVVDRDCKVIYSFPKRKTTEPFYPSVLLSLVRSNTQKTFSTGSSYNTFIPIKDPNSNRVVGGINIGISKRHVYSKTINTLRILIITFIASILVSLILLYWITKRTMKPLVVLTDGALALGKGDLSVRVKIDEKNEIGSLAESFNYMAERLAEDRGKLTSYTAELENQNKKLQQAQERILQRENKLKDAQTQLVLSEKMASLGVLIAGVAHEINTPAGAIANVAFDLNGRIKAITDHLMNIHGLSPEELHLLVSLTEEFTNGKFVPEGGSQWKKGREIRKWLAESGVENDKDVVTILSKYNLLDKERLAPYESLLKKPWALDLMDCFGTVNVGMEICDSSIKKISDIVKALKYYAYTDMDQTSLLDINENVQNVLVLMHNKLKYSIDVEKELKPLPGIHCTSEISQVWTNLISNAHDAIMESQNPDEKGKIRIETGEQDDWIRVHITDNGVGIPAENTSKMFDPFYTTKGIGKGTGLGLSIVSGIVKKHNGHISVDSLPGETTFTVSLPIKNEKGAGNNGQGTVSSSLHR